MYIYKYILGTYITLLIYVISLSKAVKTILRSTYHHVFIHGKMQQDIGLPIFDVLKYLDNATTLSVGCVSKHTNKLVKKELDNPELWKYKLEKSLKLSLLFGYHHAEYWKTMYNNLIDPNGKVLRNKVLNMYKTGKYEYVWIAYSKNLKISKDNAQSALIGATNLSDVEALDLLVSKTSPYLRSHPFRAAIHNSDVEMFSYFMRTTGTIKDVLGLTEYSALRGELYMFSTLVSMCKFECTDVFSVICSSNASTKTKVDMLRVLFDNTEPFKYSLSDYELHLEILHISQMKNSSHLENT